MAIPEMDKLRGLGDWGVTHQWNFSFAKVPNGVAFISEDLNLRCESADIPKTSTKNDTITIRGHKLTQPQVIDYGNTTKITFIETADMYVTKIFKQWRDSIQTPRTGFQGIKNNVQADILLARLNRQSGDVYYYKLFGCTLVDLTPANMEAESKIQKVTINLAFDYFLEGDTIPV